MNLPTELGLATNLCFHLSTHCVTISISITMILISGSGTVRLNYKIAYRKSVWFSSKKKNKYKWISGYKCFPSIQITELRNQFSLYDISPFRSLTSSITWIGERRWMTTEGNIRNKKEERREEEKSEWGPKRWKCRRCISRSKMMIVGEEEEN
jgi:hypothetical protein